MEIGINTKMLHGYTVTDKYTGAASVPKYQTSTFDLRDRYVDNSNYNYTRFGNPTVNALEDAVASIENAKYGYVFASGMAAISAAIMLVKTGEHVIFPKEVYGGTCQFITEILPRLGVETSFADYSNLASIREAIKDNTKMIYIETPSNPLLKVADIAAIVAIAKESDLLTVADNTFMTSLYQDPLALGCDVVTESLTKFINGHSDVVGGLAATNDAVLGKELQLFQKNFGAILGIEEAWLVLRGMKTMGLRMAKSVENASIVAAFLAQHPKVKKVYYPGLASHPDHSIHQKQATSGGAVLSFELVDQSALDPFVQSLEIPIYAVSLGGVESILSHPATMSHACLSEAERQEQGVTGGLLRLSCGVEDTSDLINDLTQALDKLS